MYIKEDTLQWLEANKSCRAITDISNSKMSILTLTFPSHKKGTRHDPQFHGFEFCAFWGGIGRQLPRKNIMNDCKWRQKIPYIVTICTLEGLSPLRHFYMFPLMMLGQFASKSSLLSKIESDKWCDTYFQLTNLQPGWPHLIKSSLCVLRRWSVILLGWRAGNFFPQPVHGLLTVIKQQYTQ